MLDNKCEFSPPLPKLGALGPERGSSRGGGGIFSHEALLAPRGPRAPSLFATIEARTFSLCLIIPNWEKNCLANQLASPQLRCPSNPALGGDTGEAAFRRLRAAGSPGQGGAAPPRWPRPLPGHHAHGTRAHTATRALRRGHRRPPALARPAAEPQPFWKAEGVSEIDF